MTRGPVRAIAPGLSLASTKVEAARQNKFPINESPLLATVATFGFNPADLGNVST
jgi:hypothetical protein